MSGPWKGWLTMLNKYFTTPLVALIRLAILVVLIVLLLVVVTRPIQADEPTNQPVHRFLHRGTKVHFYTANLAEKNAVLTNLNSVWYYEGVGYYARDNASEVGLVPVYRFLHKQLKLHFYTASESEKALVEAQLAKIWQSEGVAFYVFNSPGEGRKPVYRFLHKQRLIHFYSAVEAEKAAIQANLGAIWQYEGIAYYVDNEAFGLQPEQVSPGCPVTTQTCVPCNVGADSRCRAVSGDPTGYLGWACQNNNPGNVRGGDGFTYRNNIITAEGGEAACNERGGYLVFRDYTIGRNSLKAYIRGIRNGRHNSYLPVCANGACNLKQFFGIYAPAGDQNDPNSYANNVANRIGVSADVTSLDWIIANKFDEFIDAIQTQEGWFTLN